uniref:DUF834 domain-containing protein n=1 Tax=Oryza glumipatula TaxID=40148 RepID=A0A0D9Y5V0_9ORYZ
MDFIGLGGGEELESGRQRPVEWGRRCGVRGGAACNGEAGGGGSTAAALDRSSPARGRDRERCGEHGRGCRELEELWKMRKGGAGMDFTGSGVGEELELGWQRPVEWGRRRGERGVAAPISTDGVAEESGNVGLRGPTGGCESMGRNRWTGQGG